MQDKWDVKNKKGYLKIHVAVNIKTKEILALKVTDEKVHDSKVMKNALLHDYFKSFFISVLLLRI